MRKTVSYLHKEDVLIPAAITLVWLAALLAAVPFGNFPLNDDWAYARIVKDLLLHNRFFINNWPAMTLFSHIVWGALFCKIFGFSFGVLRLSVVVAGVAGIFAGYRLFSILSENRHAVIFSVVLLAFNPFFFSLSLTFMTDVSFTSVTLLAGLFFVKHLASGGKGFLFLSVLFCIISILIRQIGLLLPLAFIPAMLLKQKFSLRQLVLGILPFALTFAALNLFIFWLQTNQSLPDDFGKTSVISSNITSQFFYYLADRLGLVVFYLVVMAFPLSLAGFPGLWKTSTRKMKIVTFSVIALLLVFINNKFYSIPVENILYNFGIGPKLLKDSYFQINKMPKLSKDLVNVINFILLLFILPFFLHLFIRIGKVLPLLRKGRTGLHDQVFITLVSFLFLYSVFLIFNNSIFDRYFLPVYPFVLALVIPPGKAEMGGKLKIFTMIFAGLMILFSIAGTYDYFSWNRTRWRAIAFLFTEKKVTPTHIDGGFEFNGWYAKSKLKRSLVSKYTRSWWFVDDDRYIVAFGNIPGYSEIKGFPYASVLPFNKDSIFVLSRNAESGKTEISCNAENVSADKKYLYSPDMAWLFRFSGEVTAGKSHSGNQSVLLAGQGKTRFCIKLKDFVPGEKITVSTWKYPENSDAGIHVKSGFNNDFDLFVSKSITQKDPSGWVKVLTEINIPAGFGKSEIEFSVVNKGPSACWVDDFELCRVTYRK